MNNRRMKVARRNRRWDRRGKGYALVAILTASAFAMLFLFSLAGLSVQLVQSSGFFKERNLALQGAELGLDYTLKSLNDGLKAGEPSLLEPAVGETEKISDLPTELIPPSNSVSKIRIRVKRVTPADIATWNPTGANSPLYDSNWDPNGRREVNGVNGANAWSWVNGAPESWKDFSKPTSSYYWIVESTCYRGVVGQRYALSASVRCICGPATTMDSSSMSSFFNNGIVANTQAQIGKASGDGALSVMATDDGNYDNEIVSGDNNSEWRANIQTNGIANIAPNTLLMGNLTVSDPTSGAPSAVAQSDPSALMLGRVSSNSGVDGTTVKGTPGDAPDFAVDNVWAVADFFTGSGTRQGNNTTPVNTTPSQSPYTPIQVPTAPDASPLPPFPGGGSQANDVYLPQGNYETSAIDSSGATARMVFNSPDMMGSTPSTTKIFIDSNSASNNAVSIDSNMFVNMGAPSDLQIFYAGNKPININLTGSFKGLVYAPNSSVSTSGVGDFNGAIVADRVGINHIGTLQLDPTASEGPGGGGGGGSMTAGQPTRYSALTWQQVNGSLVPLE